jgi:hypothetical protein
MRRFAQVNTWWPAKQEKYDKKAFTAITKLAGTDPCPTYLLCTPCKTHLFFQRLILSVPLVYKKVHKGKPHREQGEKTNSTILRCFWYIGKFHCDNTSTPPQFLQSAPEGNAVLSLVYFVLYFFILFVLNSSTALFSLWAPGRGFGFYPGIDYVFENHTS